MRARRDGAGVRLITRHGNDFTSRFPLAAAAVTALPARSFLLDGEAIVTNGDGLAVFELIRRARNGGAAVLCAFDLIELEGEDLRRAPVEHRKHKLARLVRTPRPGIVLNDHCDGDGEIVFEHACKLGCEGIVSKRLGSLYRSGRSAYWVKVKRGLGPLNCPNVASPRPWSVEELDNEKARTNCIPALVRGRSLETDTTWVTLGRRLF